MECKKFVSAKEAASYMGVGYRMFLGMVKDGKITYFCPNGKTRKYDIRDLDKFMNENKVNAR